MEQGLRRGRGKLDRHRPGRTGHAQTGTRRGSLYHDRARTDCAGARSTNFSVAGKAPRVGASSRRLAGRGWLGTERGAHARKPRHASACCSSCAWMGKRRQRREEEEDVAPSPSRRRTVGLESARTVAVSSGRWTARRDRLRDERFW